MAIKRSHAKEHKLPYSEPNVWILGVPQLGRSFYETCRFSFVAIEESPGIAGCKMPIMFAKDDRLKR
eukprot:scaffold4095_cov117-Cylindrotheca_fusiformis.AAC.4